MRWYWLITNSNTVEDPFVSDQGDLGGIEEWQLSDCQPRVNWSHNAWVGASHPENDGEPDDNLQNHFALLIFSSRLQNALTKEKIVGIQYLPIRVLRPDGTTIEGFCVANILHCVDALDLKQSTYDRYPDDYFLPERRGQLCSLRQVTLRSDRLRGHDIVRLSDYKAKVYVSDRFKKAFDGHGLRGLSFHEVVLIS